VTNSYSRWRTSGEFVIEHEMSRYPRGIAAIWLVMGLLLAGTVGCTRQAPTPPSTPSTAITPATTARTQPNGVPRRLRLPAGPVAAQFAIRAPAPPSHTFTARILAPRQADVAVWLQTWYGQRLDVLAASMTVPAAGLQPSRPFACCGFHARKLSAPESGRCMPPSGHRDRRSSRSPSPSSPQPDGDLAVRSQLT
jgi:hypothetical protein